MLQTRYSSLGTEAGCDEAGRGCLAGPVFAAAVILPDDFDCSLLNDSKQLSEKQRNICREKIENGAIDFAVASVSPLEIDHINILKASFLAMHKALEQLRHKPGMLLIDGNRFTPYKDIEHVCIVKGDGKYASIAAASILAKTYRDEYMKSAHEKYPSYNWLRNKGYPTLEHREGIRINGTTPEHRLSFTLLRETDQQSFDF